MVFFTWAGILDGHMGQEALKKHLLSTAAQARCNVRGCDVFILDEISMISAKVFDQVSSSSSFLFTQQKYMISFTICM